MCDCYLLKMCAFFCQGVSIFLPLNNEFYDFGRLAIKEVDILDKQYIWIQQNVNVLFFCLANHRSLTFCQKKSKLSALLQSFRHFPCRENPTRALNTTSIKYCLPSTNVFDRREKIHVCI